MASEWSQATTDDGQRFVFADAGDGPLVVLIHGFPDTPHSWEMIATGLVDAGYRAVRPWLRGYRPETVVDGRPYDRLSSPPRPCTPTGSGRSSRSRSRIPTCSRASPRRHGPLAISSP